MNVNKLKDFYFLTFIFRAIENVETGRARLHRDVPLHSVSRVPGTKSGTGSLGDMVMVDFTYSRSEYI